MKRLPAQAYRLLVLLALRHARGPLTKGELAWQVRANHPMITKVLAEGQRLGLVGLRQNGDGSYAVALTPEGSAAAGEQAPSLALFRKELEEHFRFGKRPEWLG